MMMVVIAAMVRMFPTRPTVFYQAGPRVHATRHGAVMVLEVRFTLSPHVPIQAG